jgi:hypothetical protein
MTASTADDETFNRSFTDEAGFTGALIDIMPQLEEALVSVCVYVVVHRGTAEFNRLAQDFAYLLVKAGKVGPGEGFGLATWTYSGAEERFIGVDIPYSAQQLLVQKRTFDGRIAPAKELLEVVERNLERFEAGGGKALGVRRDRELAEHARVDETQFFAGRELGDQVSVLRKRLVGVDDQGAAGHAEVDDPLAARIARGLFEVGDDVFADAADVCDASAFEHFGDGAWGGFEWLAAFAYPDGVDRSAGDTLIQAVGDGFYFGELGHG